VNGSTTPSATITTNVDQEQVGCSFSFSPCLIRNKRIVGIYKRRRREYIIDLSCFFPILVIHPLHHMCVVHERKKKSLVNKNRTICRRYPQERNTR
jgi:hypothetical protein